MLTKFIENTHGQGESFKSSVQNNVSPYSLNISTGYVAAVSFASRSKPDSANLEKKVELMTKIGSSSK